MYSFNSNSFEEVAVQNDTFSGDDTTNTSDEDEDDSSSASSKNDPEHPEQTMVRSIYCMTLTCIYFLQCILIFIVCSEFFLNSLTGFVFYEKLFFVTDNVYHLMDSS